MAKSSASFPNTGEIITSTVNITDAEFLYLAEPAGPYEPGFWIGGKDKDDPIDINSPKKAPVNRYVGQTDNTQPELRHWDGGDAAWHDDVAFKGGHILDLDKAILTKDKSNDDAPKKAPKPSKSNSRTASSKTGKRTYDYSASKPSNGSKNTTTTEPEVEPPHPGESMIEQLAHIVKLNPAQIKQAAQRFKDADNFKRHFMARFGKLTRKHGIQEHHVYQIHDAASKSDNALHILERDD